jgi:hypothetical protein
MTPQDHNKTLCLLHGLIGILVLAALCIVAAVQISEAPTGNFLDAPPATRQVKRGVSGALGSVPKELYFLPLPLLQLLTAYGILRRRYWGRILTLSFSAIYVFVFPVGTLLAVYTWSFMHSAGARQLYAKPPN